MNIYLAAYIAHRRMVMQYRRTGQYLNANAWLPITMAYRAAYLEDIGR